jgi:CHAD domain-containing protein
VPKPVSSLLAKLLKVRLNRFVRNLDGVERGDIEALHRVRVASRRIRELVPVLQLDGSSTRKLGRRLRKVTTRLGSIREFDVLLLLIDELHMSRPTHQAALRRIRAQVVSDRDSARKRLKAKLPSDKLRRLARKLKRVHDGLSKRGVAKPTVQQARALQWAIEARVARRAAALQTAMESAGAVYLPERLHDVRIASKKLRYAVELSEQTRGVRNTPPVRALQRVQGLLGRVHDLQVLIERVREVQAELSPPNLTAWSELNDLVTTLEDMCRRLHARYVRERASIEALMRRKGANGAAVRQRADRKAG